MEERVDRIPGGSRVTALSESPIREQREACRALRQKLGSAGDDEAHPVPAERETVAAEPGLDPDFAARVRRRIEQARGSEGPA